MDIIDGEKVATNPKTGAQVVYRGGAWAPYTPKSAAPAATPDAAATPAPDASSAPPPTDSSAGGGPAKPSAPSESSGGVSDQLGNMWDNLRAFGQYGEQGYETLIAPVTKGVAIGAQDWLLHPQWATRQGQEQILRDIHTPYQQLPEAGRDIAEAIVPQDITSAELMAAGIKYPGVNVERTLGDVALGPLEKAMSSRLGRSAITTGVGALSGAVTGTGALQGAAQGLGGFGGGEALGAGIQKYGTREAAEDALRKETTSKFGAALKSYIPWVGKLDSSEDFKEAFVRGGATNKARQILASTKNEMNAHFGNHLFDMPRFFEKFLQEDGRPFPTKMTFDKIDKLRTDLQQGWGFTLKGAERGGNVAREARQGAIQLRDHMAAQMDAIKAGLGRAYKNNLNTYNVADRLNKVFGYNQKALFHPKYGLNQPELIERLDKAASSLNDAIGPDTTKGLLEVLKRGFVGEGKDLPRKVDNHLWLKHAVGRGLGGLIGGSLAGGVGGALGGGYESARYGAALGGLAGGLGAMALGGGKPFSPAGRVPWSMRPSMGPAEALGSNIIGEYLRPPKPTVSPAIKAAQKQRATDVAGPHASADKINAIQGQTEQIARGDSPNVQRQLDNHSLSMSNVRKMLDNSNRNVETAFNDLSPQDAIHAFGQASKDERQALLPALAQHLQNTAGKMQPQQRQQMLAQLQAVMASEGTA